MRLVSGGQFYFALHEHKMVYNLIYDSQSLQYDYGRGQDVVEQRRSAENSVQPTTHYKKLGIT